MELLYPGRGLGLGKEEGEHVNVIRGLAPLSPSLSLLIPPNLATQNFPLFSLFPHPHPSSERVIVVVV